MIELSHGHGGRRSLELIQDIILPALDAAGAPTLDAARLPDFPAGDLIFSTDSFTISPIFFPGGDIGKLSVCGTVNDLAVSGGAPFALSLAFILEEGFPMDDFRRIVESVGNTAREAGAPVACGDTKVVERGKADGVYVNVTGVAAPAAPFSVGPDAIAPGDRILLSGTAGDHGAAILAARNDIPMGRALASDCALLWPMTRSILVTGGPAVHAMRDPSRGGLAATLNELALDSSCQFLIREADVPVAPEVGQFLEALGMDHLAMANEGKLLAFVAPEKADAVRDVMRAAPVGARAAIIGEVTAPRKPGRVVGETAFGARRVIEMPIEEGLPRIC